jgi:hypothetical protein
MVVTLKIVIQSLTNLPKSMWKLVFNEFISFLHLEVLKGKATKSIWIMHDVKVFKNMLLGQKKMKTNKNCNWYGLMKIWSNFNHSKVLSIKWLRFSKNRFLIWVYHMVLHNIPLSPSNKFGMSINIVFSILWFSN